MLKKELSCFICRELLYEFVINELDGLRAERVTHHVEGCQDCKRELSSITQAKKYLNRLSNIQINPNYCHQLMAPSNKTIWQKMFLWKSWPDPLRWTFESLVVASVVAIIISLFAQNFVGSRPKTLKPTPPQATTVAINTDSLPDLTPSEFGEEEFTDHANDAELPHPVSMATPLDKRVPSPEPEESVVTAIKSSEEISDTEVVSLRKDSENLTSRETGYLYRASFRVTDIEGVTNELIDKIQQLDGKKAGSVQLGWRRGSGSYFHFSLPERNYPLISDHLKKYGVASVAKEKNPRIMPQGMIRMIFEVEGSDTIERGLGTKFEPPPDQIESPQPESPSSEELQNNEGAGLEQE